MKDKIYFREERQRWVVEISQRDGRRDYVGSFRTRQEADAALETARQARQTIKTMSRHSYEDLTKDEALQSKPIVLHLHGGGELVIERVSKMVIANARLSGHVEVGEKIRDHDNCGGNAGRRMTLMSLPRVRFLEGPDPLAGEGPAH